MKEWLNFRVSLYYACVYIRLRTYIRRIEERVCKHTHTIIRTYVGLEEDETNHLVSQTNLQN